MKFSCYIKELYYRFFYFSFCYCITIGVCFFYKHEFVYFFISILAKEYHLVDWKITYIVPFELFEIYFWISFFFSFVFCFPYFLFNFWFFNISSISKQKARFITKICFFIIFLFYSNFVFIYYFFLPNLWNFTTIFYESHFFLNYDFIPLWAPLIYISLKILLITLPGFIFLASFYFLFKKQVVSYTFLFLYRKKIYFFILFFATCFSSPFIGDQLLLFIFLFFFFELVLWFFCFVSCINSYNLK